MLTLSVTTFCFIYFPHMQVLYSFQLSNIHITPIKIEENRSIARSQFYNHTITKEAIVLMCRIFRFQKAFKQIDCSLILWYTNEVHLFKDQNTESTENGGVEPVNYLTLHVCEGQSHLASLNKTVWSKCESLFVTSVHHVIVSVETSIKLTIAEVKYPGKFIC